MPFKHIMTGGGAVLLAVATLAAAPAGAAVITGRFSGVVNAGTDYVGFFGAPGARLDGLSYVASFTYDTSIGHRNALGGRDDTILNFSNEAFPVVNAFALTINGVTDVIDTKGETFVSTAHDQDFRLGVDTGEAVVQGIAYGVAFMNLDHPVSFADTQSGLGTPHFSVVERSPNFGTSDPEILYYANFDTYRVDFDMSSGSSGVPEPAAWILIVGGFGVAGAALRRRKVVADETPMTVQWPSFARTSTGAF